MSISHALPKHCIIYTGMAKPYLESFVIRIIYRLVELFDRDDVAIYNSIPTAEGAIMMAIQNTDITIHGSSCMVLGLGRTGFTLARSLQGLGAKVMVGVRLRSILQERMRWVLSRFLSMHYSIEWLILTCFLIQFRL